MKRYLEDQIKKDLSRKMVFVGGPRQVGKTTLAKRLLGKGAGYLSWDVPSQRQMILRRELPLGKMLVFDEIHKYRQWRGYLKGLFDELGAERKILVTGSARLDYYRYGGDSLQGRYHFLRLHPLSLAELKGSQAKTLKDLLRLGGFPEPFLSGSEDEAARWSMEYRSRLIREEIADLEKIHDLGSLELLMLRLPELVGSPLSVNNLREDLQTSHKTVKRWLEILERLYAIFRVPPFGAPRLRAVKKEQKHYHLDWSLVKDPGARFENLVAVHLLKWVHFQQDTKGGEIDLRYFRDVDGREVDFVLLENRRPLQFVECKSGDREVSQGLRYLKARFPSCSAWQISIEGQRDYESKEKIRVCPASTYLGGLV
jgi:uncharacterized protein